MIRYRAIVILRSLVNKLKKIELLKNALKSLGILDDLVDYRDISEKFSSADKIGFRLALGDQKDSVFLKIIVVEEDNGQRIKKFMKDFKVMEALSQGFREIPVPKTLQYKKSTKFIAYTTQFIDGSQPFIEVVKKKTSGYANILNALVDILVAFHEISLQRSSIRNALSIQFGKLSPSQIWKKKKYDLLANARRALSDLGDDVITEKARKAIKRIDHSTKKLSLLHNDFIRNILVTKSQEPVVIDFEEVIPGDVHLELARAKWWFVELGLNEIFERFISLYAKQRKISLQSVEDYYIVFLLEYYRYSQNIHDRKLASNTLKKLKSI